MRRPGDVAALAGIFDEARRQGRRVVLRGAGLSFDGQSVDDDLAVSLERLDTLSVDAAGARFTAGPGVSWGAVYRAINPAGLYVPAAVTTASATVGGTLAANSLSRFSPVCGKEGRAIASLDVLTPDGALPGWSAVPVGGYAPAGRRLALDLASPWVLLAPTHAAAEADPHRATELQAPAAVFVPARVRRVGASQVAHALLAAVVGLCRAFARTAVEAARLPHQHRGP